MQDSDLFVILASDGVWEFISNEQAVELVFRYRANLTQAAAQLVQHVTGCPFGGLFFYVTGYPYSIPPLSGVNHSRWRRAVLAGGRKRRSSTILLGQHAVQPSPPPRPLSAP